MPSLAHSFRRLAKPPTPVRRQAPHGLEATAWFALVVALPAGLALVGYDGPNPMFMLRWPLLLGIGVLMLDALYRWGPCREAARWRWVSWGGVIAAQLWIVASMAFSRYVESFAHYERLYGSLGAVVGFMMWLWMSTIVVLFGAELNAEIEHQTAVDSTTGAALPLGERGAKMADTLGETAGAAKHKSQANKLADPRAIRAGAPKARDNSEKAPV